MLSREEIQKRIAELNAREKKIIAANPIREREPSEPKAFPMISWLLTLLSVGAWKLGPTHLDDLITEEAAVYFSHAALGLGGLAALLTLRWMIVGRSGDARRYHEATRKLESLRQERGLLDGQLRRAQ